MSCNHFGFVVWWLFKRCGLVLLLVRCCFSLVFAWVSWFDLSNWLLSVLLLVCYLVASLLF